jgi:hypothetical protein
VTVASKHADGQKIQGGDILRNLLQSKTGVSKIEPVAPGYGFRTIGKKTKTTRNLP